MKILNSLFFLIPFLSYSQVASLSNEFPKRGEKLTILYTPDSSSTFDLSDEVYVQGEMHSEDYRSEYFRRKMKKKATYFELEIVIDSGASIYDFGFFSPTSWDRETSLILKLKDENGNLYKNGRMDESNELQGVLNERELYPDNYALDFERWRSSLYAANKDSSKQVIREELQLIEKLIESNLGKKKTKFSSESSLYAMTAGNLLLYDFENAYKYYDLLLNHYPKSNLIEKVNTSYSYYLFSASQEDPSFEERSKEFLKDNPTSAIGKRLVWTLDDSEQSRDILFKSTKYWMEKEPNEVTHYFMHAKALTNSEEKKKYLGLAINKLFDDELRVTHYYTWRMGIPRNLTRIINGYVDAGAYGEALGLIALFEENSPKKNSTVFKLKGQTLEALHNYSDAFDAYLTAESMGNDEAGDSAKEVFKLLQTDDDFEKYKELTLKRMFYEADVEPANDFAVQDLEGNTIELSELKGKVVVLNFWFIGCAPCIVEMPGLNELVMQYKGEEVVFIAFALDSQSSLENFLSKKSFQYQVIPSSRDIAELYNVSAYPTHVIIDKMGNIRSVLTGGSKERHKDLSPQIDNALKF